LTIEPVLLSIVGIGGYGHIHLKAAKSLEDENIVKISSVVIRNPEKYYDEVLNLKEKNVTIYSSFEEMLENEKGNTDIVILPTAIYQHKEMAVKALELGFNVIVEKPPAATIQDLDSMIEAERRSGKFCAVGFQSQSKTVVRRLKELICSDRLGKIKTVLVKGKWKRLDSYYMRNSWAGKFMYEGEYVLDGTINNPLAHYLMNNLFFASNEIGKVASPVRVRAELYSGHQIEGEDTSCVVAETEDNIKVFFFATLCSPVQSSPTHRIIGTKGQVDWTFGEDAYITYTNKKTEVIKEDGKDERVELLRNAARYLNGLDDKINCSLEMTRPFVLTVNGAYESARMIKRIPDSFLIRNEESDSISTIIKDIDTIIDVAFEKHQLFSDLDVEWAYKTDFFPLKGYKRFDLKI